MATPMADKSDLMDVWDRLNENAKVVSNIMSGEWDTAVVWSPSPEQFPDFIDVEKQYPASGDAPAMRDKNVEGWNKYEISA